MQVNIQASRSSSDLKGIKEDAVNRAGANIYAFELILDDDPLMFVSDCLYPAAFDMFSVQGDLIPRRPCPLHCKKEGKDLEDYRSEMSNKKPDEPIETPADWFQCVSIKSCVSCKFATRPTISLEKDMKRILQAFANQLKQEDFSSFPDLTDEDRDVRRWTIFWEETEVL